MTRTAFLAALEQLLAPLPEAERKDALSYYEDYLDAAGPENEARAIAELGSPEEVARKILDEQSPADNPLQIDTAKASIERPTAIKPNSKKPILISPLSTKKHMQQSFLHVRSKSMIGGIMHRSLLYSIHESR